MTMSESLLPEFDHEMGTTRALLERVPDARAGWTPHPKSWTLGELVAHLTNLPAWAVGTLTSTAFDLGAPEAARYAPPRFQSTAATLELFDANVKNARAAVASASDADMTTIWTLKNGQHVIFSLPRAAALRSFVMNHLIHHRGQLSVYLRLNDVPLPPIYGPTADSPR